MLNQGHNYYPLQYARLLTGCLLLCMLLGWIPVYAQTSTTTPLDTLNTQVQTAIQQQDYAQAEQLYTQGLTQLKTTYAVNSVEVQNWLKKLINFYLNQGNLAIDKADYVAALAACTKAQQLINTTINQLNSQQDKEAIAVLYYALSASYLIQANVYASQATTEQLQTNNANVESWLKQAVSLAQQSYHLLNQYKSILQTQLPTITANINQSAYVYIAHAINLVKYYQNQEQFSPAATLLQQNQELIESLPTQPFKATLIVSQAQALHQQGKFTHAENLLKQLLQEQTQTNDTEGRIFTLAELGDLYLSNKRYSLAATHLEQGLALASSNNTNDSINTIRLLLASAYTRQNNYKQAEPLLLDIINTATSSISSGLKNSSEKTTKMIATLLLADAYLFLGDYAKAQHYYQALLNSDYSLPITHPASKVGALMGLARIAGLEKNIPLALQYMDEAQLLIDKHPTHSREQAEVEKNFAQLHLWLLELGLAYKQLNQADILPTAFKAMQQAHGQERQQVLQQMALHLSANNPQIHQQLQTLWAEQTHLSQLEKQYLLALTSLKPDAVALSQITQDELSTTEQNIQQYEQQLSKDFSLYQTLIKPDSIDLATTQTLLANDEALLIWTIVNKGIIQQQSYLMVVRANHPATFYPLAINNELLKNILEKADTGLNTSIADPTKPYDMLLAYGLYQQLMAPAEKDLIGVKHIIAITDGYLQNLPLAALIRTVPTKQTTYQTADWLAQHYAFSYLPSVKALAQLRSLATTNQANNPQNAFIGFGDPLVQGKTQPIEYIFKQLAQQNERSLQGSYFFPNTTILRQQLTRLPETADEIQQAAELFKVNKNEAVYLGERATENQVKQLSAQGQLRQARILSFATHALLPKYDPNTPLNAPQEAGLVLTPPQTGTAEDDGYLSATEAAALDLNADWILLSACNTGVVTPNQTHQGLSQLTQAFFSAGSRSVLASQWSVDSRTTEQLMTNLLTTVQAHPQQSHAESLRQSMLHILNGSKPCNWLCHLTLQDPPSTAHPAYWAAFKLYGEGGLSPP